MKTIKFSLLFALSTSVLSGCAVAPVEMSSQQRSVIPEQWSQGEGVPQEQALRVAPKEWWASWGDETLNELIGKTLDTNTDIATAQANLRSAMAALRGATASLFPTAIPNKNNKTQIATVIPLDTHPNLRFLNK